VGEGRTKKGEGKREGEREMKVKIPPPSNPDASCHSPLSVASCAVGSVAIRIWPAPFPDQRS